jgi:ribosomal protein L32
MPYNNNSKAKKNQKQAEWRKKALESKAYSCPHCTRTFSAKFRLNEHRCVSNLKPSVKAEAIASKSNVSVETDAPDFHVAVETASEVAFVHTRDMKFSSELDDDLELASAYQEMEKWR